MAINTSAVSSIEQVVSPTNVEKQAAFQNVNKARQRLPWFRCCEELVLWELKHAGNALRRTNRIGME